MVVEQSFSYSQAGAGNMSASRIYSKLLEESDADRKAEAAKIKWDGDGDGELTEEEVYVAEQALLSRQKAILDIILLLREKIASYCTGRGHVSTILLKVFKKFDEDNNGTVDWYEFDRAMIHLGVRVSEQELAQLMEIFDTDGTGEIRWREFLDWVDDRKPMTMAKMRRIIAAHEGSAHAAKKKHAADVPPSHAYMKAWLDVHGEATDAHVAEIAARGSRGSDGATLTDGVKLMGGASKIDAAMATRKKSRVEVIDALRAAVLKRSGDVPLRRQLEIIWRRFDPTGAGVVDWRAFTHGMRSLGLDYSTDELTQIMKEFDANCDGHIDWVEFVGHLMPRESDDVAAEFERLSMARKAMLRSKGISRAGDGTPGVRASRPRWE